jgi:FKBP-type peptidyl-prolyl cis-trans isomerase SlyD
MRDNLSRPAAESGDKTMQRPVTVVDDDVVVSLDYTLRLDDDEVVETTEEDGPLEFLQGHDQIIPGLEQALYGMAVGDEKDVVVEPEEGYGEYDAEAFELVPINIFPDDMDLSLGMPVELYDDETDEAVDAYVAEIRTDTVLLDLNHPLSGETLYFHVRVAGLRAATPEELEHGHAHEDGHGDGYGHEE